MFPFPERRDRWILVTTTLLAVGVPCGAAAWLRARTTALADHLTAAGGVTARIGRVDADLTGAVRGGVGRRLFLGQHLQPRGQHLHGAGLVLQLRALVLARDHDAGG